MATKITLDIKTDRISSFTDFAGSSAPLSVVEGDTVLLMAKFRELDWSTNAYIPKNLTAEGGQPQALRVTVRPARDEGAPLWSFQDAYNGGDVVEFENVTLGQITWPVSFSDPLIKAAIGTDESVTAWIEFTFLDANAIPVTLFAFEMTIFAQVDDGAVGTPPPTSPTYLTAVEIAALYMQKGDNGYWPNVIDKDLTAPPVSPALGDTYIVGTGATGAWAGQDGSIAVSEGSWTFYPPSEGWAAWLNDENILYIYKGAAWEAIGGTLLHRGDWNASTNSPDINATAETGDFWIVSVAGSTDLGGSGLNDWEVSDWAVKIAGGWAQVKNGDLVKGAGNLTTQYRFGYVNAAGELTESASVVTDASGNLIVTANTLTDSLQYAVAAGEPGGAAEGWSWWDNVNHTVAIRTDQPGVTLQVGQEDHDRTYNNTTTIPNATPVYATGAVTGGVRDVDLAEADATGVNVNRRRVFGLTTHEISNSAPGVVTSRGLVNEADTSAWEVGDELWLSSTPGELVNERPLLPASQVRCGMVMVKHATLGVIAVKIDDLSWVGLAQSGASALERTGFVLSNGVPTDSAGTAATISVDAGTRTFSLNSVAGSVPIFSQSNLFVQATPDSVVWTDVEGNHFFYYDASGVLQHSEAFDTSYVLGPNVFVGYLYWDATNSEVILSGPLSELHGLQMDGATHLHFHDVLGAQVRSGLALSSLIVDGGGTTDPDAQFGVEDGSITDEDLTHSIAALLSTAGMPILYLSGAGEDLRETAEVGFSVLTDVTAGVGATGRLVWNEFTGGAWQLTTVGNGNFVLCHVFAIGTGTGGDMLFSVIGQDEYSILSNAQDGVETELGNLVQKLPFQEVRPIASVIFQTGGYGNAVNARVRPAADGDYQDWRTDAVPGGSGFTPSDHNALSGRSDAGAHPGAAVTLDTTNFDGNLSPADDTVQKAMETLDEGITASTVKLGDYSAGATYAAADMTVYGGVLWISLQAANLNHTPAAGSAWWREYVMNQTYTETGTALTISQTQNNKRLLMTNAAANVVTIPLNSTTAFSYTDLNPTIIPIVRQGAGKTTITATGAATLNGVAAGSLYITQQYGQAWLIKVAADAWVLVGDISTNRNVIAGASFSIAASDEDSDLAVADAVKTFRMPYAMTLTEVRASVKTAPTGSVLTVDVKKSGVTIFSTLLTIDAGEKTSVSAATPAVISDGDMDDDEEVTINIDGVGSTVAGTGLTITFKGIPA